ncbi:hypothetical protein BDB00DRAFT_253036 [Zychaea mexicana]|uniref:uncharacterized protein n=1 Tax=Zychaea mexicana TaxID=64656 RepID=UPI0022FF0BFE|nr:uncharacterized protein BDB00DRAFT_253036 [Zychaea mexicana]KAI9470419.1 hypothetical protein BDB00DRAFT_253036 [Zychaea mexicana]
MLPPSLLELNSGEPEIQTLSNLWVSANAAFDSCDFGGALSDLDAAVAEVEQNVLAIVLLKRAVAHSCQGNTQAAIQDAYKVIKLAPRLPEGYLCAGSLLKSAKRYGEAIEIYWNGIQATESFGDTNDCASRKNNEGHQRIVRAKHIIEESINRINDQPLKKLPLELAHHIFFDLLSFEDRLQSMYTCRWWRAFLVEELPRISLRLVLGSMPKQAMVQLVAGYSSRHLNEELGFKNRHAVSILPNTSAVSFKNALMLLNDFSVRIKHLAGWK